MRPAMSIGKVLALGAALVAGLAVAASIGSIRLLKTERAPWILSGCGS